MKTEDFWKNVDVKSDSECWVWKKYKNPNGYGYVRLEKINTTAHIAAYRLTHDDYDKSLNVCHKCNNPSCCNPNHLYLGTQKENMQDMVERYKRGELIRQPTKTNGRLASKTEVIRFRCTTDMRVTIEIQAENEDTTITRLIEKALHAYMMEHSAEYRKDTRAREMGRPV